MVFLWNFASTQVWRNIWLEGMKKVFWKKITRDQNTSSSFNSKSWNSPCENYLAHTKHQRVIKRRPSNNGYCIPVLKPCCIKIHTFGAGLEKSGSPSHLSTPSGIGTTALLQKICLPPSQFKPSSNPPLTATTSGSRPSKTWACRMRLPHLLQK